MKVAISIVQSHILADDSCQWGPNFMRAPALEAAVYILINLLGKMDPLDALAAKDRAEKK